MGGIIVCDIWMELACDVGGIGMGHRWNWYVMWVESVWDMSEIDMGYGGQCPLSSHQSHVN